MTLLQDPPDDMHILFFRFPVLPVALRSGMTIFLTRNLSQGLTGAVATKEANLMLLSLGQTGFLFQVSTLRLGRPVRTNPGVLLFYQCGRLTRSPPPSFL